MMKRIPRSSSSASNRWVVQEEWRVDRRFLEPLAQFVAAAAGRRWPAQLRVTPGQPLRLLPRLAQVVAELGPRPDTELVVGAAEVRFDGSQGHEESLSDLAVCQSLCGHLGHPALARSERLYASKRAPPRARTRREEFLASLPLKKDRTEAVRQIEPTPKRLTSSAAPSVAADRRAEVDERAGVFQGGRRMLEHGYRLAEQFDARGATLDQPRGSQCDPDRARSAKPTRELELLVHKLPRLLGRSQLRRRQGGARAPRDRRRVLD